MSLKERRKQWSAKGGSRRRLKTTQSVRVLVADVIRAVEAGVATWPSGIGNLEAAMVLNALARTLNTIIKDGEVEDMKREIETLKAELARLKELREGGNPLFRPLTPEQRALAIATVKGLPEGVT